MAASASGSIIGCIAGLGNLIVDGILWEAGIDPARRSDHLDGAPMAKKTVAGRTSYYCPQHQH
jgi:formamidopyrimidine-DNA glycosylase